MEKEVVDIQLSPAKLFDLYLSGRGISSTWVANSLDVSVSLISKIRSERCVLTETMREKMNDLLGLSY